MLRLVVVRFAHFFSSSPNELGSFLFLNFSLVLIDFMLLRVRIFLRNWLSLICRGCWITCKDLGNYFQEVTIHGFFKENNIFLPSIFFIREVVTSWFDFTDCIKGVLGLLVSVFYVLRKLLCCELIMNYFQSVRDYVILLRQGSEGCQDGIIDVFEQENLVKWVNYACDWVILEIFFLFFCLCFILKRCLLFFSFFCISIYFCSCFRNGVFIFLILSVKRGLGSFCNVVWSKCFCSRRTGQCLCPMS